MERCVKNIVKLCVISSRHSCLLPCILCALLYIVNSCGLVIVVEYEVSHYGLSVKIDATLTEYIILFNSSRVIFCSPIRL